LEAALGRFAATLAGFLAGVRGPLPAGLLLGFWGMSEVPENAALSGLSALRKVAKSTVWQRCNWGNGRYSPREFDRTGRLRGLDRLPPVLTRIVRMFITPAYAQAAGAGDTSGMLMSLLPFALIFVIMYFLILRPQQKKVRDHADLVKNIRRGDTVVTSGGLVGKVTKVVDDDQIEFEIADGVRVRQMRSMVSGVRAKGEPAKESKESAKDDAAAK
jgi:preprotein translocase subunit YajC